MAVSRPTNSETTRRVLSDLQAAYLRVQDAQTRLSSGRQISAPEDDPFGAGRAITLRTELGAIDQHTRNVEDAQGFLEQTEIALGNITQLLQRARELAVQAANTTLDQEQLDGIAAEIEQIRQSVQQQMNTTYAGRSVFGGSATLTAPYDATGAYVGNDELVKRVIGDGQTIDLNVRGWEAFSVPPTSASATSSNVLGALGTFVTDLTTGNRAALSSSTIPSIDGYLDQVTEARAKVGSRQNRLETTLSQLADAQINVKDLLSKTEDVDVARAMIDYSSQQATYESALRTAASVLQPSLLDFLG